VPSKPCRVALETLVEGGLGWLVEDRGHGCVHVLGCRAQLLSGPCLGSCLKTCRIGVEAVADPLSRLGGV
jgi:hypothetical protein